VTTDEDVAGEDLLLNGLLATSSIGMTTSKMRSSMFIDWIRAARLAETFFS